MSEAPPGSPNTPTATVVSEPASGLQSMPKLDVWKAVFQDRKGSPQKDPGLTPSLPEGESSAGNQDDPGPTGEEPKGSLTDRFLALSKKDKAVREERKRVEAEKAELQVWKAERDALKQNPLRFLESNNITFEQLTDLFLDELEQQGEQKADPVQALAQEVEQLRKEREDEKVSARQAQENEVIDGWKADGKKLIDSEPDRFELLRLEGQQGLDDVWDLVETHFIQTNGEETLTFAQAAELYEGYLYDEKLRAAKELMKAKKLVDGLRPAKESNPADTSDRRSFRSLGAEQTENERDTSATRQTAENRHAQEQRVQETRVGRFRTESPDVSPSLSSLRTAAPTAGLGKPALTPEERIERAAARLRQNA